MTEINNEPSYAIVRHLKDALARTNTTPKEFVSVCLNDMSRLTGSALLGAMQSAEMTLWGLCILKGVSDNASFRRELVDGYTLLDTPLWHPHPNQWYVISHTVKPSFDVSIAYTDSRSDCWISTDIMDPKFDRWHVDKSGTQYWPIKPHLLPQIHHSLLKDD